ncbi:sulfite exporter TauE/SafE family protein, partial [bacterium]|nr:sulfite exporter TauE/SafE family protein [bacterium]
MKIIILAVIFLSVSLFFSMIGMGGGMFYVPILLFAKTPIHDAASISLSLILVTSVSAFFVFSKNKLIDWKLAAIIDPPTDIMAFAGGYFSGYFSDSTLQAILAFVLIIAGIFMLHKGKPKPLCPARKTWWCWERNFNGRNYRVNLLLTLPITAGIGILSGMLGVTGGIIKLPLMVLFCGVPMDIAIATSTIMVAVTALFGLTGHILTGHFDPLIILPLTIFVFIGGKIGSHLSLKSDKAVLKKIFAFVLIG